MKLGKQCKNKVESSAKKYKLSTTKQATQTEILQLKIQWLNWRILLRDSTPDLTKYHPLAPTKKKVSEWIRR